MDKETGIREIVIYDGATGAELNRFSAALLPEDMFDDEMEWLIHGYPPGRIGGFLKDNRRLVYSDDHVVVLDTESGVKQVITPTDGMTFSFAPESETVAVPRANEDIEIRDLNSVAVSVSFHGHGWETLVTLSRDGRQMLIPGAHSFTIWDTETGAWVKEYEGISDDIQGLAFSPSGTCVITYGQENTVQFWDLTRERDRESRVFLGEDGRDSGLRLTFDIPWPKFVYDFNSEISLAAFANQSGDIGIWEVPSFRMVTS
jgi:WD40 repeat protein